MNIKYDGKLKQYILGNSKYNKKQFITYIESDMLEAALLKESVNLNFDNGNINYMDMFSHNLYGIHIQLKNAALSNSNPHICVGWSKLGNLLDFKTKEELKLKYDNMYPLKNNKEKELDLNQIWRFYNDVKIGDYIIFDDTCKIHIGRITSNYYYNNCFNNEKNSDYVNNRKVEWIKTNIDRDLLSTNLQKAIGVPMCFFSINDFKYAIYALLNNTYQKDDDFTNYSVNFDNCYRKHIGENIILYGVPGVGKSYTISHTYIDDNTATRRVVFHPDYTYSDFVGQILPKSVDGNITYEFVPGPFTKIVSEAYCNPTKKFILIIEEVNRGNAPAIFGDIFQLLDRDMRKQIKDINGNLIDNDNYCSSYYGITNCDIAKVVYNDETHVVKIPSNLSIICTMNTSDQNVFTLDTAFQRRWSMRLIENSFKKDTIEEKEFAEHSILDTNLTWEKFCEHINELILQKNENMTSSEDKRLGTHFVCLDDLIYDENETNHLSTVGEKRKARLSNRRFAEKVIKYLWDDAFKFYRNEIFKDDLNSLEKIITYFVTNTGDERFDIFKENIKLELFKK